MRKVIGGLQLLLRDIDQGTKLCFLVGSLGRDDRFGLPGGCEGGVEGVDDDGMSSTAIDSGVGSGIDNWASRYVEGEGARSDTDATHVPAFKRVPILE